MLNAENDNPLKEDTLNKKPIISFLNYKGGVGKTNVSVNFAYYSATFENKKTLLIDWDPQGDSTEYIGVGRDNVEDTMFDILVNGHVPEIDKSILRTPYENLFIIGANATLKNIESYISKEEDAFEVFRNQIIDLTADFDVVIIDCPPANSHVNIASLFASTDIYIITTSSSDSIDKIGLVKKMVDSIVDVISENLEGENDDSVYIPSISGIILTLAEKNTIGLDVANEHIKEKWGDLLIYPPIPRTVAAVYSVSERIPLLHNKRDTKIAQAYIEVFKEVFNRVN